jgi:hypothetical protein
LNGNNRFAFTLFGCRIFDLCMNDDASSFLGIEQWHQASHLQQWLGLAAADSVELGHIVESPTIRTATSIVPLGWNGVPGAKNGEPLKVDITGFGLHLCTLVHAQVNGDWYCHYPIKYHL